MHATGTASCPRPPSSCDEHDDTSVRVALRARPLVTRERLEGAKACIAVEETAGTVVFGSQRRFAFDHAFGPHSTQDQVYETCVSDLVDAVVEGYNATVLAYGPTGSGKTYTMGTGSALHCVPEQQGIIPRVIRQLFEVIGSSSNERSFVVRAQFLEIYNEELRDLLASPGSHTSSSASSAPFSNTTTSAFCSSRIDSSSGYATLGSPRSNVMIRECPDGQIVVTGAREEIANSCEDLAHYLDSGALARATGATSTNEQSSRSHAIFTVIVEQSIRARPKQHAGQQVKDSIAMQRPASRNSCSSPLTPRARLLQQLNHTSSAAATFRDSADASHMHGSVCSLSSTNSSKEVPADGFWDGDCSTDGSLQMEYRCAKFHLVDLAGSERTKRSGAVGARFKETVTINQGLLALGNVISALGNDKRRLPGRHVPYRDSKLTRLLQDSLGGNSKTLMIACISSADDVLEENLNTLKYASRARHIRNRPVVNRQKLGSSKGGVAGDVQALQLLLLRRFTHQVLGPLTSCAVPEQLLADVSHCGEAASVRLLRELQVLAAVPKAALTAGLSHDIQLRDQEHQQHSEQLNRLQQQVVDLDSILATTRTQAAALEMQLDLAGQEKAAAEQAVAEIVQQQNVAQQELLLQIDKLQESGRIGPAVRSQLSQQVLRLLKPLDKCQGIGNPATAEATQALRVSLQSHPLPILGTSCCDDTLVDAIRAAKTGHAGSQRSSCSGLHTETSRQVEQLKQQLAEATSDLQAAQQDLAHDEDIFAQRVMEMAKLRDDMAIMASVAQQDRAAAAAQIQHLQADLRRWRMRALALQGCSTVDVAAAGGPQGPCHAAAALPGGGNPDGQQPYSPDSLVGELSFAGFAGQQSPTSPQQQQQAATLSSVRSEASNGGNSSPGVAGAAEADVSKTCGDAVSAANGAVKTRSDRGQDHDLIEDDQVLFDDDLASYISETDYTDLRSEDSNHLIAELQAVLADKAALEDEKATAQAEAAAAQQSFERSRALLESQLAQLSSAISSQETLISTLQSNEAEARQLGALYLDRCRELEAELAELQLDLEDLTSALAQVEADAAASAEEKQRLRTEYEQKISTVVEQMSGLQRQMKGQDVSRVERERQRAALQVQQLQGSLVAMRAEQETLRKRLQERLLAQEKSAADKTKELAALRRAAEVAKRRVLELEHQNKRQQAELRARTVDAARAQKQLKELETQALLARSKPCFGSLRVSPGVSPRVSPRPISGAQATGSPRKASSKWPSSDTATVTNHQGDAFGLMNRATSGSIFKYGAVGRRASRQPSPVGGVLGNGVAEEKIATQANGEATVAADLQRSQVTDLQQQQQHFEDPDCVQLSLPVSCAYSIRIVQSAAVQPIAVSCSSSSKDMPGINTQLCQQQQQLGRAATGAVSSGSHHISAMQYPSSMSKAADSATQVSASRSQLSTLADAVAMSRSRSSISSSIASLTGDSKIRSWLKSQLQLLAVKQNAEVELEHLQKRYEAAVQQRNQLLAATAVLDIQQMRKDNAAAAVPGNCFSSNSSSSRLGCALQPGTEQQPDMRLPLWLSSDTVRSKLPDGLCDQLDAAGAQLEHLTHQMQQQQAQSAAADEATAQLRAQVPHMSVKELGVLLEQALDLLVEQASLCQTVAAKANCLELDLQQQQQQLEEATSRLHSTQLHHQVQVTNLQQEHEQRLMELLRQPATAAATPAAAAAAAATPATAPVGPEGEAEEILGDVGEVLVTGLRQVHEQRLEELLRQPATAAGRQGGGNGEVELHHSFAGVLEQQCKQPGIGSSNSTSAATAAAERTEGVLPAHVPTLLQQQPPSTSAALGCRSADASQASTHSSTGESLALHYSSGEEHRAAGRSSSGDSQAPAAAAVDAQEPVQSRLSPRQGSPTKGPQLSDLMACLAQRPSSRQQVVGPGTADQSARSHYVQLIGRHGARQQEQGAAVGPGNSLSSSASSSMLSSSGAFSYGQQQQHLQQDSPTSSAESSPSKAQAKLAAYRRHLQSASCNTSIQKQMSASSSVSITQSGSGRSLLHNSPTRLQQLHSHQQNNGNDDDGSTSSSSPSRFQAYRSSTKRQSGELRALASYAKSALSQAANVHDQTGLDKPLCSVSPNGKGSSSPTLNSRTEGCGSIASSTQTVVINSSPVSNSPVSNILVSNSLGSNSSMIRAIRQAADNNSSAGLLHSDSSSSSRMNPNKQTSPLRNDRDSPLHAAATADAVDRRSGSGDAAKYGTLDLSPAKLVAAAAALLRDAGLDPDDADEHGLDQL